MADVRHLSLIVQSGGIKEKSCSLQLIHVPMSGCFDSVGRMEDAARELLQIVSKTKIASRLSYPVSAEQVSTALASVPQFHNLGLHFLSVLDHGLRPGLYEFLRVEYLYPPSTSLKEPHEFPLEPNTSRNQYPRWGEIAVGPVPRLLRLPVMQYSIDKALPDIVQWLKIRERFRDPRSDMRAFFYDEQEKRFFGCSSLERFLFLS